MKTLNKLIFTTLRGRTAAVLASDKRILQIEFEEQEAAEQIGTIYIGKVRNVVKNLNAAFVEYKPGVNGYYSLNDNRLHVFADGSVSDRTLKSGDEILVQVSRAAVKTKDAVLSGEITLTGRYAAVLSDQTKFGISAKIRDKKWKEDFRAKWNDSGVNDCGLIIRTNAYETTFEMIRNEVNDLKIQLDKILHDASFRTPYSVLYCPDSFPKAKVRDLNRKETEEIITDISEIYEELSGSEIPLRLYEDSYPLRALYHLETELDHATSKNVWLKSGGYLVIEPTEAMTVIDVNTGKNVDKKSPEDTYFKTNMEAAVEIAAQLRLRNISGIIIVDFIDMADEEHNTELLNSFKRILSSDPVKTTLIDMTSLGLVEITRKKIKRPLMEQLKPI